VIVEAARSMVSAAPQFDAPSYARAKRIPVRFLNAVIEELVQAGYLAQLSDKQGTFALLKSPAALQVSEVVNVVMNSGATPSDLGLTSVDPRIVEAVEGTTQHIDDSLQGATIDSLLGKA